MGNKTTKNNQIPEQKEKFVNEEDIDTAKSLINDSTTPQVKKLETKLENFRNEYEKRLTQQLASFISVFGIFASLIIFLVGSITASLSNLPWYDVLIISITGVILIIICAVFFFILNNKINRS